MRCLLLSILFAIICTSAQASVPGVNTVYILAQSVYNYGEVYRQIYSGAESTLFQIGSSFYVNNGTHAGLRFAFNLTNGQQVLGRWKSNFYVYSGDASKTTITAYSLQAPFHSEKIAEDLDFTQSYVLFQHWLVFNNENGVEALNLHNSAITRVKRGDFSNVQLTATPIGVLYNWDYSLYLFNDDGTSTQVYSYSAIATTETISLLTSAGNYIYFNFSSDPESVYRTAGVGATKVAGVKASSIIQAISNGLLNFIVSDKGAITIQLTDLSNRVTILKTISDHTYYFEQALYAPSTGLVWFLIGYTSNQTQLEKDNIVSVNEVYTTDGTSSGTAHVVELDVYDGGHGNTILATGDKLAFFAGYYSSETYIFAVNAHGDEGNSGDFDGHGGIPPSYGFSDNKFYCWLDNWLVEINGN